jgi:hypothetical protein
MVWIISPHLGPDWKRIQKRFVDKYTDSSHALIQYPVRPGVRHIKALRACMKILAKKASPGDLCVVLDSDAFPIDKKWIKVVCAYLRDKKYVAVQRLEAQEAGKLAHPCFTAWPRGRLIEWSYHGPAKNPHVKGSEDGSSWKGLHRTNHKLLHPRLYSVYGDIVYHHGAGSRDVSSSSRFNQGLRYNADFWANPDKFIRKLRGK